jgi:hypothetical protein
LRRILLVFSVTAVMVAIIIVSSLPAVASPPSRIVERNVCCPLGISPNEASSFRDLGQAIGTCERDKACDHTQTVEPNPGKGNPYPPGKGEPPLP